jgi:hypothetical protein
MAYAATLAPGSTRVVVYFVAGVGAVLVIWDTIQRQVRRRNGKTSKHPKTEIAIVYHETISEVKGYALPNFDEQMMAGAIGLMDVTCKCYFTVPEGSPTVQLLSGTANIEIDGRKRDEKLMIFPTLIPWQKDGYKIPPYVEAGETLLVDLSFLGRIRWDNGWVVPNRCVIHELVIRDQFKKKHRLKEEIVFHPSWRSSPPSA